ncbi:glycosyltransferase involved in cell wall biosynthesis [Methanohalophilus levihalophilus]|uniref:glycosyltransferase family 2 protein n=1 Tax=Methanohalophilus levihalophilus TaxID=1431282 RepID=UPI001AE49B31|nr:glycosyltransferase family 2 protein [Methanohalophilus levihalophilus]MBP2029967.1 glycosyltransferase involved in cell wall biosynthesis [Methanohalophilus levihalophilus]
MLVSVIVCAYDIGRYDDFIEAIESLFDQDFRNVEIIAVVDGNKEFYEKIIKYKELNQLKMKVLLNKKNLGLSESRNRGIAVATGDVLAFFDDDAIAEKNWISELVRMYDKYDAIAAGGKLFPLWVDGKADFLPEEFYWMIGATHKGFPEKVTEVRNTFGSNISFKKEVLDEFEGFKGDMGIKGKGALQAEETEICERMKKLFGKGVMYNPHAIVHHKIFKSRTRLKFLLRRAFWQGYSKKMMANMGYSMDVESDFLKRLINPGIYGRVKAVRSMGLGPLIQIFFLILFTFVVSLGYAFKSIELFSSSLTGAKQA